MGVYYGLFHRLRQVCRQFANVPVDNFARSVGADVVTRSATDLISEMPHLVAFVCGAAHLIHGSPTVLLNLTIDYADQTRAKRR